MNENAISLNMCKVFPQVRCSFLSNLTYMWRFAQVCSDAEIVQRAVGQFLKAELHGGKP